MIPTSIDGTDITGATIDGTDVTEITVDGDTVFTAETLPVAYSNLIAWYPFDSSFYGGSDADDATALFNPSQSGDSTAYDGTVSGATYQSSGGVTDINAGANSGAFNFDGSNDKINTGNNGFSDPISVTGWGRKEAGGQPYFVNAYQATSNGNWFWLIAPDITRVQVSFYCSGGEAKVLNTSVNISNNTWHHHAFTYDSTNGLDVYVDGTNIGSASPRGSWPQASPILIGEATNGSRYWDGDIEDVRIYDTKLSGSQVSDIYNNTEP